MNKSTDLIGERVSDRTLMVSGPELKLAPFCDALEKIGGITTVMRESGRNPDDVGVSIFIFTGEAEKLLTLLPPIGVKYTLTPQEAE